MTGNQWGRGNVEPAMPRLAVILIAVIFGASACLGGGVFPAASPPSKGRLSVTVKLGLHTHLPVTHRYTLTCGPAAGTMPNPKAACAALADYQAYVKSIHGPQNICRLVVVPTATAVVSGTYSHKRFLLKL